MFNRNYLLCTHYFTSVPFDDLVKYLIQHRAKSVLVIKLPLFLTDNIHTTIVEEYCEGKLIKSTKVSRRLPFFTLRYLYDVATIIYVSVRHVQVHTAIGLGNLCALLCVFLRFLGRTRKAVYYAIDFTPHRFDNAILNKLFHLLDFLAAKYSDATWNMSNRILKERQIKHKALEKVNYKQLFMPAGIWTDEYASESIQNKDKYTLVYAGSLSNHQGVDLAIRSLQLALKTIPDLKMEIIGKGSVELVLRMLVEELDISKHVFFKGYFENHIDVIHQMQKASVALAMYNVHTSKWSQYGDPSKIKSYLACGLPTLTTNVTYMAEELKKRHCGYVVDFTIEDLTASILKIFKNRSELESMQRSCINYSKEFNWEVIFTRGFNFLEEQTLKNSHSKVNYVSCTNE